MALTRRRLTANLVATLPSVATAFAAPRSDPKADRAAAAALRQLIAGNQAARLLNEKAVAVLIFPKIVKVGFLLGGAYGEAAILNSGFADIFGVSAPYSGGLSAGRWRPLVKVAVSPPRRWTEAGEANP